MTSGCMQKHNLSLLQESLNSTVDYSRMAEYTSKLQNSKVKIKNDMSWKWETNIASSSGFKKSNCFTYKHK